VRAIVFDRHGGPEVLNYTTIPDPCPGAGEVLIRVRALTVNPGPDVMTREGTFALPGFGLPHVGGSDPAGEVVAVGDGVTTARVGDRVVVYPLLTCGTCVFCRSGVGENYCENWRLWGAQTWGGRAELAKVPAANVVSLPACVSWQAAATLPVAYLTAWHGLVDRARVDDRDTVLVVGAAGGVGVAAIQIARHFGARVIAASGDEWKRTRVLELGAQFAVNSRSAKWSDQVLEITGGRGATVVFDNVGEATWAQSVACLARAGRFVCSGATTGPNMMFDARWAYRNMVSLQFYMLGSRRNLERLVELVADGSIVPVIDSRFALGDIVAAEHKLATQDHFGKIVLDPDVPPSGHAVELADVLG
jgi:NADPH:quinone reductase-like Zn-dependent oxidoreductase